jgi:hypothetical protein
MLRPLASGLITRSASKRLARYIPNPLLRIVAIAVAGYAIDRLVMKGTRRMRTA